MEGALQRAALFLLQKVLAVIFLMYRFLLKDKLIMELMAEKEVS